MERRYILIGVGVFFLLAIAYYGLSPLFRNTRLDEVLPSSSEGVEFNQPAVPVEGTVDHPASGTARIVESDSATYIRYENFKTINGPDLFVYLAKDLGAKEFVNLGELKATEGNINYEVPEGVNVADYPYVLTWCRAFGALFNSARINK